MEIVSIESGRATWLFPTEEFVPLGGTDGVAIIQKVVERYEFKNFPQNPTREDVEKNGLRFGTGIFENSGKRAAIGEFALYNDGLVAVSNTTEHSNAFLNDIVEFVINEFQFRPPISPIKKIFVSVLTVEFDNAVSSILANQAALLSLVGSYLNAPQSTSYSVEITRLDLALADATLTSNARPKLILEARQSVPLARRRYYSNAAMHTKDHLELLSRIEETFMPPSNAGP
jgi:hypothetical protein